MTAICAILGGRAATLGRAAALACYVSERTQSMESESGFKCRGVLVLEPGCVEPSLCIDRAACRVLATNVR